MTAIPDVNDYGALEWFWNGIERVTRHYRKLRRAAMDGWPAPAIQQAIADAEAEGILELAKHLNEWWVAYEAWTDDSEWHGPSKAVIAQHVGALLDAYPSHRINSPAVYVRTLIDEIAIAKPARVVLEAALRDLKRTYKTPPSLAAVFEAIDKRGNAWGETEVDDFEWALDEARAELAKREEVAASGRLMVGQTIKHERLGLGTITRVHTDPPNSLSVRFPTEKLEWFSRFDQVTHEDGSPVRLPDAAA